MNKTKLIFVLSVALLSGCVSTQATVRKEEMYIRASALTKLTAAVESMVRYKNPSALWTDEELLAAATAHDPHLLLNMRGYKLSVLNRNKHAVVLVCTISGERALLEDAGCTGPMDRHHWQQSSPCDFSLSIDTVCGDR